MAARRFEVAPGEEVLVRLRPHWSALSAPLAAAVVVVGAGVALDVLFPRTSATVHWVEGVVVAVPCVWLAMRAARWWSSSLILTDRRLVQRWGMLVRRQGEVGLDRIDDVAARQSVVRHLLGTGRLELAIRGELGVRWIDDVRKPDVLARVIARRIVPWPGAGPAVPPG